MKYFFFQNTTYLTIHFWSKEIYIYSDSKVVFCANFKEMTWKGTSGVFVVL